MPTNILRRNRTWYLKRRVPSRFAEVESRAVIWESLKTESESVARLKADAVWLGYLEAWEARLAGRDGDAEARVRAARNLAKLRGFSFLSVDKVAKLPVSEIVERVLAIPMVDGRPDPIEAAALLGTVEDPGLMLSGLAARVEDLARHDNRFKNTSQLRVWRNANIRAARNLQTALGTDIPVVRIGIPEARAHRRWLKSRVEAGEIVADTANKDFSHMSGMLKRFYEDLDQDDAPRPYAGISITDRHAKKTRKLEVPAEVVSAKWLAEGAFDGMNEEARDILLISLETGCRQSEIHDMPASALRLDDPIPHLLIANEDGAGAEDGPREIKNSHSERKVPLVGLALAAARRHPAGFPRYRDTRSYSAAVNTYLREHDLVPQGVTAGGTRHLWETRLKRIGVDTDDRGEILGHSVGARRGREVYGDAMSLERRRDIVASIAFPVPDHLA